jgi:vanillate O-demethylase monooxygenase subunit
MSMPSLSMSAWHEAARSEELVDRPLGCLILDTPIVLFRDADGQPVALRDRCPHGLGPLSTGYMTGEVIVCAYHGLRVDKRGNCVDSRVDGASRDAARVDSFAVEERDGILWVWMGDQACVDRDAPELRR